MSELTFIFCFFSVFFLTFFFKITLWLYCMCVLWTIASNRVSDEAFFFLTIFSNFSSTYIVAYPTSHSTSCNANTENEIRWNGNRIEWNSKWRLNDLTCMVLYLKYVIESNSLLFIEVHFHGNRIFIWIKCRIWIKQ